MSGIGGYPLSQTSMMNYIEGSPKRKQRPPSSSSPSNQTSSPENKKAHLIASSQQEAVSNELSPAILTPQRDKLVDPPESLSMSREDGEQEDDAHEERPRQHSTQPTRTSNETTEEEFGKIGNGTEAAQSAPTVEADGKPEDSPQTENKQDTNQSPEAMETDQLNAPPIQEKESIAVSHKEKDQTREETPPEKKESENTTSPKSILRSALKSPTFRDKAKAAAHLPNPTPLLPRWKPHRFAVTFDIKKKPGDKSKRTEYIATELNKMLATVTLYSKVYVRKYAEYLYPRDADRKQWISKFDKNKVSDITLFTHGFYFYQELREGMFRLLVQLILPCDTDIPAMLINVNGHKWTAKQNRSLRDIREQHLHAPKYIGWLFRSNYGMAGSEELQKEFTDRAGINFGLTFKSIPLPKAGKYNRETAIKGICISVNEEDQQAAWSQLFQWYNSKRPVFPLGIPMMFVPSKEHPDIKNNPAATQNISTLMDRQRIFLRDTETVQCPQLAFPGGIISGRRTLRHELMDLSATTMGEQYLGAKLFHAITKKVTLSGEDVYVFTYHKAVEREALSIVSGIGQFIKTELKLDPEEFCYPHLINDDHGWDTKTRCARNPVTDYLAKMNEGYLPEEEVSDDEKDDHYSMDTKGKRESKRILGQADEETIKDLTKKKESKRKKIPSEIADFKSVNSEMSGLSVYSSSTKASLHRKALRMEITDKDAEIEMLKEALKKQSLSNPVTEEGTQKSTGEHTSESPPGDGNSSSSNEVVDVTPAIPEDVITHGRSKNNQETVADNDNDVMYMGAKVPEAIKDTFDGLKWSFRGPPKQIEVVEAQYREKGIDTVQSKPYTQNNVTYIDLYQIVDREKFRRNFPGNMDVSSVRFSVEATVQTFNQESGELEDPEAAIAIKAGKADMSVSSSGSSDSQVSEHSNTSGDQSEEEESSDESSSASSNSSITSDPYSHSDKPSENSPDSSNSGRSELSSGEVSTERQEKTKAIPSIRASGISREVMETAKSIVQGLLNTTGDGPDEDG